MIRCVAAAAVLFSALSLVVCCCVAALGCWLQSAGCLLDATEHPTCCLCIASSAAAALAAATLAALLAAPLWRALRLTAFGWFCTVGCCAAPPFFCLECCARKFTATPSCCECFWRSSFLGTTGLPPDRLAALVLGLLCSTTTVAEPSADALRILSG